MAGEMTTALIGVAGVAVGGALQLFGTLFAERAKADRDSRTDAYRALIDAMARIATWNGARGNKPPALMSVEEKKEFLDLQMNFNIARNRLAIYASPKVLQKVATFTSGHARLESDADVEAYINFLEEMRGDSRAASYEGFRRDVDNLMLRGMMKA